MTRKTMAGFAKLLLSGVIVPVAGTLPLILYIAFGPPDGNPIGLGLLAWLSWLIGLVFLLAGLIALGMKYLGK